MPEIETTVEWHDGTEISVVDFPLSSSQVVAIQASIKAYTQVLIEGYRPKDSLGPGCKFGGSASECSCRETA